MSQIQSDSNLASYHATALSAAVQGGSSSVGRDERTTVFGNANASQAIDDLLSLQQEIEGLVTDMMGNIQGLAAEFQAADKGLSQGF